MKRTALFLLGVPVVASAQALASPFSTISQKIDSTTIAVEYYRPSVRGREIFGRLVKWGQVWTPGANWATTLEVDRDVKIEGRPLPRGKYSIWMIPAPKPRPWTLVFNRNVRRFHVVRRDSTEDQLRVDIAPDSSPHVETLTFSFPGVSRTGTTLAFDWAETRVPIRVDIISSRQPIAAAHPWASYAGVYALRDPDADPARAGERYEVSVRENGLWVHTTAGAVELGLDTEFDLLPAGGDAFHPRQYKNRVLIGDELDEVITFRFDGGRVSGFEVRGVAEDKVLARASLVTGARR
jgi:hypothetical protein